MTIDERALLISSRRFAYESVLRSWCELLSTFIALAAVIVAGILSSHILVSLSVSLVLGLLFVRLFAIYHDYMHSSIFRRSPFAGAILKFIGLFLLAPPSVWKRHHDHHHKHNSKLFGIAIGSFRVMTVKGYRRANLAAKLQYRFSRSASVLATGYLFVFLWGMCIAPLLINPRKHLDCVISLILHACFGFGTFYLLGGSGLLFLFVLPFVIATATGSYLFYVQHNFPGVQVADVESWTYTHAALTSTSHLNCGGMLDWFTANIGYHHVHHLNAKIPFYRLSETHLALPPLQTALQTTLRVADITNALRLKLWNEEQGQFVSFASIK